MSPQPPPHLMESNNPTALPDHARDLDAVLDLAAHSYGSENEIERATCTPLQRSNEHNAETAEITNPSLEILDKDSVPVMPTGTASTSRITDTTNPPCSQFNSVNYSSTSDEPPVPGEGTTSSLPNEEPTATTYPTLVSRTLSPFTLYGELSVASTPEQFASVHARLQEEWTFNVGLLVAIAAVNTAIFSIAPDSIFKVDSYAHSAVAMSSAACGLGIACDVWFLIRYNWVDLETFIYRSRDIYGSYLSFSLSSRTPNFCMLVSSISLMCFLGLSAFDASPGGVLVIVVLVVLLMTMQYIVYGTHQFARSVLHIWRAGAIQMVNVVERLRGFPI